MDKKEEVQNQEDSETKMAKALVKALANENTKTFLIGTALGSFLTLVTIGLGFAIFGESEEEEQP